MQDTKGRELVELIERTFDLVPEALSLMEYLHKPNPCEWVTTNACNFQIMHRKAPFSLLERLER